MSYFSYLSITGKNDVKETYIEYLIKILNYTDGQAKEYSKIFYNEDGTLKCTSF